MIDCLETEKSILQNGTLSKHDVRTSLADEWNYDFDDDNDEEFESKVNDTFNVIRRMLKVFGDDVYTVDSGIIGIADGFMAKAEYRLCIHCMDVDTHDNRTNPSTLFERIAAEALCALFGKDSAYELCDKTGSPDFSIKKLAEKMNVPFRREFQNDKNVQEGDGSCDLVFWKKLDDRAGKIIVLMQCKSGKKWGTGKPVHKDLWTKHLIGFYNEPIISYAVSDLVTEEQYASQTIQKGLLFDRARIVRLLAKEDSESIKNLRIDINQYLSKQ